MLNQGIQENQHEVFLDPGTMNKNNTKSVLPVSLLAEGKSCLVVGGGNVAARKIGSLLEAGAEVTIVSPEACEEVLSYIKENKAIHICRNFESNDVNGRFLVFATTDSESVNKTVLDACREQKVLCCAIDSNWPEGDFVSPASFTHNGITVSVATGGKSCVQARDVKNTIKDIIKKMNL